MRKLAAALVVLVPALAQAKAWKNVNPGQTPAADVLKRFGEPTTRVEQGKKKQVLAYKDDEAIEGTKQVQFFVDEAGVIDQIAVFPAAVVERGTLESSFGPDCSAKVAANCYVKKVSDDDFKTYYWYANLGLVVFLNADGNTVQSFLYVKPQRAEARQAANPSPAAPAKSPGK